MKFPSLPTNRIPKRIWLTILLIILLSLAGTFLARHTYDAGLGPVSNSQQTQIFTVEKGSTVKIISVNLEKAHLIRSAWAFQLYVHSKELNDKLQAGTYALSPSDGTPEIVSILTNGRVATRLVTILPGRRIDQVRADLINSGFTPEAVDNALNPANYSDLPALAYKPADVNSLEGLLWPDSFQKQPDTDPAVIIRESLVAMGQHLTPDMQAAFAAQGLTTYQGLILASIVMQEVSKPDDQTQAAQVFLSRLKSNAVLQSDATAKYGAILDGRTPDLNYDSAYNTYLHSGLPLTPISTVNASSLAAAAHPASTNWLYFVTGDDGTTYFSTNLQDHEAATKQYCHKLCGN
jgi:UPF0755 protein